MLIIATISKASFAPDKIKEIILAGADVLRYNFSHGTKKEMKERIDLARKIIIETGKDVKILADLPGAKVRLGIFDDSKIKMKRGEELLLSSDKKNNYKNIQNIPINIKGIGHIISKGKVITIGDGEVGLKVKEIINENAIIVNVLNNSNIPSLSQKGLNIGDGLDNFNHFTNTCLEHIKHIEDIQPDMVAFSFVKDKNHIIKAKELLHSNIKGTWKPLIISKIETLEGVKNIYEISSISDMILIARGDLGLNVPYESLGIIQKRIIKVAHSAQKKVIVSTQILESTLDCFIPKRSDILDLTNIVLDEADGIMLCKETGINYNPGHAINVANKIIKFVENNVSAN